MGGKNTIYPLVFHQLFQGFGRNFSDLSHHQHRINPRDQADSASNKKT
jgi:hypothetical protein